MIENSMLDASSAVLDESILVIVKCCFATLNNSSKLLQYRPLLTVGQSKVHTLLKQARPILIPFKF